MIYNKGAPADFNEWESLGNKGWAYSSVSKYMKKAETFDHSERSALTQEDVKEHGSNGPWKTGYSHLAPLSKLFIDACQAVGIPATPDWNTSKGMVGSSQFQTFIDPQGQRSSTAVAYLTENVARRPNLSIATGQTVTKIIFDNSSGKPRAVGVEMAASSVSPIRYIVKARKEVILSAGAIGTPQVLKLSGVGPSNELKQHGIQVVKDVPGVGANLADHLCGIVCFETKAKSMQFLFHPTKSLPALIEWIRFGKGAMTSNAAESGAFIRVADREDAPESLKKNDLSAGPGSVDLELLIGPLSYIEHGKVIAPMDRVSRFVYQLDLRCAAPKRTRRLIIFSRTFSPSAPSCCAPNPAAL
jgi:choline dehydrogenase